MPRFPRPVPALTLLLALLAAPASRAAQDDASVVRVRAVEVRRTPLAAEVAITGDVQAQAQVNVAFRTSGKIATRMVEVGDHVAADQVLARLDPLEQRADLDNAKAALASAEALLTQAKVDHQRQAQLLAGGYTTRSSYDNAEQRLRTTQASVESAKAALGTSQEQFSYTDLRAGVDGIVLSRSFETGQVVQAGQTILVLAQDGPRDAVFNVSEALLATPPESRGIAVTLQADPAVTARGQVREIAPTVDAASGTVRVKVGLDETPAAMGLGAVVIGHARFSSREAVVLPWSALYRWENKPAVWILERATGKVAPRLVQIERYGFDDIALRDGVAPGESVIVAGIQFLRPGQTVSVVESAAPKDALAKDARAKGASR